MDIGILVGRATRARFVLIGSATHGTEEFHRGRTELTRRLIVEGGFRAIAVEGDWREAERVDRYVRGRGDDMGATQALGDFRRFPAWMWRNTVVAEFVPWLRGHNDALLAGAAKVGFYGLDLHDPDTSPRQERYDTGVGDDPFATRQRARAVAAGQQYRACLRRWPVLAANIRARHMANTLAALVTHLEGNGELARTVVWAHNGHVGDARATEFGARGERSLGQLVRERQGADVLLVGFTTYTGTVTAARDWEEPPEQLLLTPALRGSHEEHLHQQGVTQQILETVGFPGRRLERAVGGVYRARDERAVNYFAARIRDQFDAVVHIDETHAVEPLLDPA
jgi:erythromycin esterase-like protein